MERTDSSSSGGFPIPDPAPDPPHVLPVPVAKDPYHLLLRIGDENQLQDQEEEDRAGEGEEVSFSMRQRPTDVTTASTYMGLRE